MEQSHVSRLSTRVNVCEEEDRENGVCLYAENEDLSLVGNASTTFDRDELPPNESLSFPSQQEPIQSHHNAYHQQDTPIQNLYTNPTNDLSQK
jgi:hypothetical protein